jgi:hypothetical protein
LIRPRVQGSISQESDLQPLLSHGIQAIHGLQTQNLKAALRQIRNAKIRLSTQKGRSLVSLIPRAIITNTKFDYVGDKKLAGKLRYFERREQANEHLSQRDPNGDKIQCWIDMGLGQDRRAILKTLKATATSSYKKNVLARRAVISPAVNFMQAIPEEKQIDIIKELT